MAESTLEEAFTAFLEDLEFAKTASGESAADAFFQLYAEAAAENGDTIDLMPTPARKEGVGGYQIDGSAFDAARGVLYLAVADFRPGESLETLNAAQIDSLTKRARKFVELALDHEFVSGFKETDPEFEAGYPLAYQPASVRRIRIIVFSNARLATRRPPNRQVKPAGVRSCTTFSISPDMQKY